MIFKNDNWKNYFILRKINSVIRILTISDVLIISGFGLVAPIFAVFITDSIKGGTLEVVGIASAVYLLAKSLGQIPVAVIIDKISAVPKTIVNMPFVMLFFIFLPLFMVKTK